jgi:hypothetical protein
MVDRRRIQKAEKLSKRLENHTDQPDGIGEIAQAVIATTEATRNHEVRIEAIEKVCRHLCQKLK